MQMMWYLFKLFMSLGLGVVFAYIVGKKRFHTITIKFIDIVLYTLLFFMGVNTGLIPDITLQIAQIGLDALISTILVLLGCLTISWLLIILIPSAKTHRIHAKVGFDWDRLKMPLQLIGVVALGVAASLLTPLFSWFDGSLISPLLYVLLFLVGLQMVQHEVNLLPLLRSPMMLLAPLCTVLGTYLGALAIPIFTAYSLRESLALVSGFGWYTLSGVLLSDLGAPELGAVSFLSNLFRESASFIVIPLLSALPFSTLGGLSIAGATSMDVTLPILKKSFGDTIVPLAIVHGSVITLLAPFFIPLWYR
jgi:uncharacterized membrane protein YbjE (DUF340 family)